MAASSPREYTQDETEQSGQRLRHSSRAFSHGGRDSSEDDLEYEPPQSAQTQFRESSDRLSPIEDCGRSSHLGIDTLGGHSYRELSDPPDPHRANKYHGPVSTWRDWTAAERDVARSIDMIKAKDLSVHLYNSYALRSRCQKLAEAGKIRGDSNAFWIPSNGWSAWPMLAHDVPRLDEDPLDETLEPRQGAPGDRSRQDLREILLARITKVARDRFKRRDCEGCDGAHSYSTAKQTQSFVTENESVARPRSSSPSIGMASVASATAMKRSYSDISASSTRSQKRKRSLINETDVEPVPMTDDDQAMRIARPSIEHIISSLERLLNALHVARQHYFSQPKPQRKPRNMGRRNLSQPRSEKVESSQDSDRRSQIDQICSSESLDDEDHELAEQVHSTSQPGREDTKSARRTGRLRTFERYGLRDWTDILGLAAMLGWDDNALRRTRDRCSILFEGFMPLINLDLDPQEPEAAQQCHSKVTATNEDGIEGGVHVDGYLRPIERRKGWRGKNLQKGNWRTRAKSSRLEHMDGAEDRVESSAETTSSENTIEKSLFHVEDEDDSTSDFRQPASATERVGQDTDEENLSSDDDSTASEVE